MQGDFIKALEYIRQDEGDYVDHPRDPGGATNMGITQATYDLFRTTSGKATRPVKDIGEREVEIIYRVNYWTRIRGDQLPHKWAYLVMDYAVHSGCSMAVKRVQEVLGFTGDDVDGKMGPKTIGALNAPAVRDSAALMGAYLDLRLKRLKDLPTWGVFGHGWSNRLAKVRARVL